MPEQMGASYTIKSKRSHSYDDFAQAHIGSAQYRTLPSAIPRTGPIAAEPKGIMPQQFGDLDGRAGVREPRRPKPKPGGERTGAAYSVTGSTSHDHDAHYQRTKVTGLHESLYG